MITVWYHGEENIATSFFAAAVLPVRPPEPLHPVGGVRVGEPPFLAKFFLDKPPGCEYDYTNSLAN